MKNINIKNICYSLFFSLAGCFILNAQNASLPTIDQFDNWTDEDYQNYEDSLLNALYPLAISQESDQIPNDEPHGAQKAPVVIVNNHVPDDIVLDKNKAVGEIPISSGTTSTGAKTYHVPLQVYPGINGFEPKLSFDYNSMLGNGSLGFGWALSGTSSISRIGQSVYYDGKTKGIALTNDDAFALDGVRLIKLSSTSSNINYETEQGNIKVKAFLSETVIQYFKVYYPNGNKGVFGLATTTTNKISYPLTTLSDPWGNEIVYTYSPISNVYRLERIRYNNASVEFLYTLSQTGPIIAYSGGLNLVNNYLFSRVVCKFGSTVLGSYDLTYSIQNNRTLLTQIDYSAVGQSFNPLKFYYGEGITSTSFNSRVTQLHKWYTSDNPEAIRVVKGKFDYGSSVDGLISLPNQNPYWKHYRNKTWIRHSQNRFDNKYTGNEDIYLYAGLQAGLVSPMPDLKTGVGFIDIFCADIEGKQEENIIKVNNQVDNSYDKVTFRVYRSNLYTGLSELYTRTYNFSTVYTDQDGGKSIQPKFYYTGDFNGDGKMEVLAVSCHQPFGDTTKPSKCYLFDLAGNKIMYENHLFAYNVDFLGSQQSDKQAVLNNTDRLFVIDYDGDGKSDICLINDSGVNIYTFDVSGSSFTGRKVATYNNLRKSTLADKSIMIGEFNGDGLMDLLVSPAGTATTWYIYNSRGDGSFASSPFTGPSNSEIRGFLLQDINSDGLTDLIRYDDTGFHTYLCVNNKMEKSLLRTSYSTNSIILPTDINSRNSFNQLIYLKDGIATKLSFSRNEMKESLMTGMANSYGLIEKNHYFLLSEGSSPYGSFTKGYGATYPYVNITEPSPVLSSCFVYMNGKEMSWNYYSYNNAVFHRQGLGFRGFEQIKCTTKDGEFVQIYNPYSFSTPKSEETPYYKKTYNYNVSIQGSKLAKIRLINQTEVNKLVGTTVTASYIYDTYGNPTSKTETYPGSITLKTTNTYSNLTDEDNYMLGLLKQQIIVATRNGETCNEMIQYPSFLNGSPTCKKTFINGNKRQEQTFIYDDKGNVTQEDVKHYSSSNVLSTKYIYDAYSRLTNIIDPLGLSNRIIYNYSGRVASRIDHKNKMTEYIYDDFGRVISSIFPDNSTQSVLYSWSSVATNGLYAISSTATGRPDVTTVYDALGREVRSQEMRFDGTILSSDKLYDEYGRLQKVSMPFEGNSPSLWTIYHYDSRGRPISITEASGRKVTYSYNGLSETSIDNGISIARETVI